MPWWESTPPYQQPSAPEQTAKADMRIDIYHHLVAPDLITIAARLDQMQRDIAGLITQGNTIMATTTQLLDAVNALTTAVAPLGDAINTLEAAVTAALAQVGGIPAADQANIDAAFAAVQDVSAAVAAALADAADGVDEAKPAP